MNIIEAQIELRSDLTKFMNHDSEKHARGYRLDSLQHINRIADLENRRRPTVTKKPIRNVRPTS